ncbi:hypothetical protein TRAPUB_10413, partial [Trametes pubescens]
HTATADLLRRVGEGEDLSQFTTQGLRPVYRPFWADLPHTDMFECITPDILHQIHKGVIKDHFLPWCQKLVGKEAVDERVAAMPESHGLRHFKKGVSLISQWTGTEAKELEKILLGIIAGRADSEIQKAARGLLDFVYYAQYEVHTETTLARMKRALDSFHRHKQAFITHGIREHFNIPKIHSLVHYVDAIRRLGCLDGVNTETSERLHIDYAKKAYRASSRREYYTQMTTWLQRQEAIERRDSYLAWITGQLEQDMKEASLGREDEQEHVDEAEEDAEDAEPEATGADVADEEVQALRELINSNVSRAFQLSLTPTARRVTLDRLSSGYGAPDFLVEVNAFLSDHDHPPRLRALTSLEIDVYHTINVLLPANIHCANHKRIRKIRATPAIPRNRDHRPIPPHFDCGLFVQDEDVYREEGGLQGLRAGRIRVIFRLPEWMKYDSPLMYVEWFRPFRSPDPVTGMPSTSRSTRAGKRNATVVEARDLLRPCHLIPKFGQEVLNANWAAPDLLDEPITFCFNRYLDYHTFDSLAR